MLFLTDRESRLWRGLAQDILDRRRMPWKVEEDFRPSLLPAFYFYAGTFCAANGCEELGAGWIREGVLLEEGGYFSNAFMNGFLSRTGGRLTKPAVVFSDPGPFMHFAGVPIMKKARERFVTHIGHSLPVIREPFRIMDIGCGNGALVVSLVSHLRETGAINDIGEILLIDPSKAMCGMAKETVGKVFDPSRIRTMQQRIEAVSDSVDSHYHVALASLSYHHMPYETKLLHLKRLAPRIDHFTIFELDANNDLPELYSPELALSVYQSYGELIDYIFSHDGTVGTAIAAIDNFLITEEVSILTEKRGERSDYHMLRIQWHELIGKALGSDFACLCDSTCHSNENMTLFTLHHGRQ
jgi:SAM-dependent methyltransferase